MNTRIKQLLEQPLAASAKDLVDIKTELSKYPYFQPLTVLQLKALQAADAPHFESELHKVAVYCSNRMLLYNYIQLAHEGTEPQEENIESELQYEDLTDEEKHALNLLKLGLDHMVENEDLVQKLKPLSKKIFIEKPHSESESSLDRITEQLSQPQEKEDDNTTIEKTSKTEIEPSTSNQKSVKNKVHSFNEWLHLPEENACSEEEKRTEDLDKFKIIDAFLSKNPKISPPEKSTVSPSPKLSSSDNSMSHLMTETLAKIYVEQKKYDKAIKAYTILRLKYPEKSGFFADRIKEIKQLKA